MISFVLASTEHFPEALWLRLADGELLPNLKTIMLTPRPAQMPALVAAISRNWEHWQQGGHPEVLEVIFCGVFPLDEEAVREGIKPLERFRERGQAVTWM
uniref:Uncharacterized protein n=1 Tax=Mycena chlorophos TaxID=658473 RepID=A0ABQ0MCT7_MYCCL|nr:predicted protein [Mycena chlorophos]